MSVAAKGVASAAADTGRRDRLMFFAPSPSEPGGAEKRTRLLADALAARGWEVIIVGRTTGRSRFVAYRRGRVRIIEVPGFERQKLGAACFLASALLAGLSWGVRARAFLGLQLSSPATAAAICGLLTRKPFAVLSSTAGTLSETSLLLAGRGAPFRRWLLRRATRLIAQTDHGAGELAAAIPGAIPAVLPNPVLQAKIAPLSGVPRVAFAGRMSEEKDLIGLLEAWVRLLDLHPHAQLVLIGAGGAHRSVETELRAKVASAPALTATVRFTGWVDDPEPELSSADVFVLPSLSEGMSNALLEACSLGRIVVASDIPANVAVLGSKYPLLFAAGDREALLGSLSRALEDDAVRALCRAQITARLGHFAPSVTAERLETLLFDADRAGNK